MKTRFAQAGGGEARSLPLDGIVPAWFPEMREDSYWAYFDTSAGQ
jgi:hypothetical protein